MSCSCDQITSAIFVSQPVVLGKCWRELRNNLTSQLSDLTQLELICNFWKHAPLKKYAINWDEPQKWPDPWQLMHDTNFDESSIALGMYYTLLLGADTRWNSDRLKLILIKDYSNHIQRVVLHVDNTWLLNYDYATVIDTKNNQIRFAIQQHYSYNGKIHSLDRVDNFMPIKMLNPLSNIGT